MGLKSVISKIRQRNKENKQLSGFLSNKEMLFSSSLIIYQYQDEIYIAKNRINGKNEFVDLTVALDLIIKEYLKDDLKERLTPSAMFNVPIKEDLDNAIRDVLVKHKLIS